jgi:hypothetical protein
VEEAKAHFPTPPPGRLSKDSTGRPPVLEDGSRLVGRRLTIQSIHTTGAEMGSVGHTPYHSTAILFGGSKDEDDNIECGRCDNPIAYCHCDNEVLIIPPPITIEENDEETQVSTTETANDEGGPVEVCVVGGVEAEANLGGGVQVHC